MSGVYTTYPLTHWRSQMNHLIPERREQGTIHTPAICDSGAPCAETRANTCSAGSTAPNEAVHIRGPAASKPSFYAASDAGSRP